MFWQVVPSKPAVYCALVILNCMLEDLQNFLFLKDGIPSKICDVEM